MGYFFRCSTHGIYVPDTGMEDVCPECARDEVVEAAREVSEAIAGVAWTTGPLVGGRILKLRAALAKLDGETA